MESAKRLVSKFQEDELITIKLEGSTETYTIQKALLCEHSAYFKGALQGEFKEGRLRTLSLPDCDIGSLHLLIHWLCLGKLPNIEEDARTTHSSDLNYGDKNGAITDLEIALIRLWVLGAKVMPEM